MHFTKSVKGIQPLQKPSVCQVWYEYNNNAFTYNKYRVSSALEKMWGFIWDPYWTNKDEFGVIFKGLLLIYDKVKKIAKNTKVTHFYLIWNWTKMIENLYIYSKRTKPTQNNLRKVHQMFYQCIICNYLLKLTNISGWSVSSQFRVPWLFCLIQDWYWPFYDGIT